MMDAPLVENLEEWISFSKDPNSRSKVINHLDSIVHLTQTLIANIATASQHGADTTEHVLHLIQSLQVLRNMCAGGATVCDTLQAAGLLSILSATMALITCAAAELNWRLPSITAQVLANACVSSATFAAAAWPVFFPSHLLILAHIRSGSAPSVAAFALLTFCKSVEGALETLISPGSGGGEILSALLCGHVQLLKQDESNSSLGILLSYICFQRDMLRQTFTCLDKGSHSGVAATAPPQPFASQVLLLQELTAEAQHVEESQPPSTVLPSDSGHSMAFLVDLTTSLAHAAAAGKLSQGQQQALQDGLQLMRDLGARGDDGAALSGGRSLANDLVTAGVVPFVLASLKALGPPRSSNRPGPPDTVTKDALAAVAPALAHQALALPSTQPYPGYRSDVLSVLANLAHRRPAVSDHVVALGAEPLVLAQCQVDVGSPMSREWGLWAVRNVCEGSDAARTALSELRACAATDNEELRRAGLRVTLDEESGKVKVESRVG